MPTRCSKNPQRAIRPDRIGTKTKQEFLMGLFGSLLPFVAGLPALIAPLPPSWILPDEDELLTLRTRSPGPALAGNKHLSGWGTQDVKH